MMDRHSASSRMDHEAEGAQAEWLGAMQSLAEQIEKQQQSFTADDPGGHEHLLRALEHPSLLR